MKAVTPILSAAMVFAGVTAPLGSFVLAQERCQIEFIDGRYQCDRREENRTDTKGRGTKSSGTRLKEERKPRLNATDLSYQYIKAGDLNEFQVITIVTPHGSIKCSGGNNLPFRGTGNATGNRKRACNYVSEH